MPDVLSITILPAPLADRLERRAWDDDVDDDSRELLEAAAAALRLQADALADAGIVVPELVGVIDGRRPAPRRGRRAR